MENQLESAVAAVILMSINYAGCTRGRESGREGEGGDHSLALFGIFQTAAFCFATIVATFRFCPLPPAPWLCPLPPSPHLTSLCAKSNGLASGSNSARLSGNWRVACNATHFGHMQHTLIYATAPHCSIACCHIPIATFAYHR